MNTKVELYESKAIRDITTGGMMIALFALSSNVIPPIQIIPNVPITLQILVIIMIGALLGIKNGLFCVMSLLIATFFGLPFMSGFKGGPGVFISPTGGFIFGFILIVLIMGIYKDFILPRLMKGRYTKIIHFPVFIFIGLLAVLVQYACGAIGLGLVGGSGLADFSNKFLFVLSFLPWDILKIITAAILTFPLYITVFNQKKI